MNLVRLVALLIYTFGAFAYGGILYLSGAEAGHRAWAAYDRPGSVRTRELDVVNAGLLVLTFLWFLCNGVLVLYGFVPRRAPWYLDVATVCMAFVYPPIIMHLSLGEVSARRPVSSFWRNALWPVYGAAITIPAWTVSVLATTQHAAWWPIARQLLTYGLSGLFLTAAVFSMALIGWRGEVQDPRARRSRRWTFRLFALMAVTFALIVSINYVGGVPVSTAVPIAGIIELTAKSLPLVFMFIGTYNENRFQFFDLFVKRGASLLVTLVALAASFAVLLPLLRLFAASWAAPWLSAVLLLPTALAIPWMNRHVGAMLDRQWLGRRFGAVDALKHLHASLRSATSEQQLRQQAARALEDIFDAKADVVIGEGARPAAVNEQVIPVRSGERIVGHFHLGPRANDTPYFSQDITLLTSLAGVFAYVLENLQLQERKLEQEQRARELSLHASRSELKALRAQINPHFLFNALNSIAGLIHRDPAIADRTIEQLADVFRYALRGAESEWAVLDDELDFVRAYLDVERARFGDRLHVHVRLDDSARGARVPTMVVQTLVENAIKHGVASVRGRATVVVDARRDEERLVVSVSDNGSGFTAPMGQAPSTRGGYGLVNVRQRLEGYFGSEGALTVTRGDGLTVVSVSLPLTREEPRARTVQGVTR